MTALEILEAFWMWQEMEDRIIESSPSLIKQLWSPPHLGKK